MSDRGQSRGGSRGRGGHFRHQRGRGGRQGHDDLSGGLIVSEQEKERQAAVAANMSPEVRAWFLEFQKELDDRNDKYERIVKLGRDVTIESKRIIFQLHRITTAKSIEDKTDILDQSMIRLNKIRTESFHAIARELVNEDNNQFLRAYSPGLQEFIEATTFFFYLRENRLLTVFEVQVSLAFPEPNTETLEKVPVPLTEYLLGVGDIAGELMRYAINSVSAGDLEAPKSVAGFLKNLYNGFIFLGRVDAREFGFKVETLRRCLLKVENAQYTLRLRGSEVPEHMLADIVASWGAEASNYEEVDSFDAT